jgi:hypothetical protein
MFPKIACEFKQDLARRAQQTTVIRRDQRVFHCVGWAAATRSAQIVLTSFDLKRGAVLWLRLHCRERRTHRNRKLRPNVFEFRVLLGR